MGKNVQQTVTMMKVAIDNRYDKHCSVYTGVHVWQKSTNNF